MWDLNDSPAAEAMPPSPSADDSGASSSSAARALRHTRRRLGRGRRGPAPVLPGPSGSRRPARGLAPPVRRGPAAAGRSIPASAAPCLLHRPSPCRRPPRPRATSAAAGLLERALPPPALAARALPPHSLPLQGHSRTEGDGSAWSHVLVAQPPIWKPQLAPNMASGLELQQKWAFGRAPAGAACGALPNTRRGDGLGGGCRNESEQRGGVRRDGAREDAGGRCSSRPLPASPTTPPLELAASAAGAASPAGPPGSRGLRRHQPSRLPPTSPAAPHRSGFMVADPWPVQHAWRRAGGAGACTRGDANERPGMPEYGTPNARRRGRAGAPPPAPGLAAASPQRRAVAWMRRASRRGGWTAASASACGARPRSGWSMAWVS
ncbi:hypothetical protein PVAP13_5KG228007 [Panicum virgatum]|uniref:Uncharacterized protein n=1 Tax=Panicum virgatum TaxID=38727 RepID=A0A8T0SDY6_PANVG|nr:hypothetical protein PVAP13_5KG228007 [Panicum virgatum]